MVIHNLSQELLPSSKGSYLLEVKVDNPLRMKIGKLGVFNIQDGIYLYAGGALGPGGLKSRVGRHARQNKKKHWHIDYLLTKARLINVFYKVSDKNLECRWSQELSNFTNKVPIPGFGSSDCRCASHLFRVKNPESVANLMDTYHCQRIDINTT